MNKRQLYAKSLVKISNLGMTLLVKKSINVCVQFIRVKFLSFQIKLL